MVTLNLSGSAPVWHRFVNSIHDPDYETGGHQPLGHDQWATFYNSYRVRGIRYDVTFSNNGTTEPCYGVVLNKNQNTTVTSSDTLYERPNTKILNMGIEGSGQSTRRVTGYHNCAQVLGLKRIQYTTEKATSATFGTNPSLESWIHVGAGIIAEAGSSTVRS